MDITVNSHLTIGYLELVTNYVRLCVLLSRVEDRKVIIGLYCHAHDVQNGFIEAGFAHLAEFIVQYYDPIKKLSDEFSREHQRRILQLFFMVFNFLAYKTK